MYLFILLITSLLSSILYAHQPVMDMAPRWEDGYGIQLRQENYGSNKLLKGSTTIANPYGLKRFVYKTWLEGIYTFSKEKRITFKLPYIKQQRTKKTTLSTTAKQKNRGIGDVILGIPLKKYTNNKAATNNISFTPSLRIPTGSTTGDYPIGDGSWDLGLSLSYSNETPKIYQLYDLFFWKNTKGKRNMQQGDELGLDINLGYHAYHNDEAEAGIYLMLDIRARYNGKPNVESRELTNSTGGKSLYSGPILVVYQENIMFRIEYTFPVYEKVDGIANSQGQKLNIGLGITF